MAPKYTFPVSSGLLEPKHVEVIGTAIWTFLWCLNRTTTEREEKGEKVGLVLGGATVSIERIAKELGKSVDSVRRDMRRLADEEYLILNRRAYGFEVKVRKSKKFAKRAGPRKSARDKAVDQSLRELKEQQ